MTANIDLMAALPPDMAQSIRAIVADLPDPMPVGDASRTVGVTTRTFRRWAAKGKVRVLRTSPTGSGRVRVPKGELVRLLVSMYGAA